MVISPTRRVLSGSPVDLNDGLGSRSCKPIATVDPEQLIRGATPEMTETESGSLPVAGNLLGGTSLISNNTIAKIITTLATLLNIEDASEWTREGSEIFSRLISVGIEPLSQDITSNWLSLLFSTGWWSVGIFSVPVLVTGIIWYFILTWFLKKNVMGFLLGRSLSSPSVALEKEEGNQAHLARLTRSVSDAIDHPR
ncbi:uncharacterized protein [Macrobrachium rosenbergii]|uniref:uncharacterized protein n=1 Tax=Macrobrachium rosenbergii TaxID=79674 RepID=UPI0034D6CD3C